MELTYDDLYCHQDILKNLMKVATPNLYSCYIWGANDYCSLSKNTSEIANIFLGIRDKPGNFTTKNVAAIYADGQIQTDFLTEEQLRYMHMWLRFITPQQKRYDERISQIKDELLEVCYHPDNVYKLIPLNHKWRI